MMGEDNLDKYEPNEEDSMCSELVEKPVERVPFLIVIDSREKKGYNIREAVVLPLVIGDYSVRGLEGVVAVERKSHDDLFMCLTTGRTRFIAQLRRMSAIKRPLLVIDATASSVLMGHVFSKISGEDALRRLQALCMKYSIPYVFADGHGLKITLNHLLFAYREHIDGRII